MELKDYQRRVLERFDEYIAALRKERDKASTAVRLLKEAGADIPEGLDDYPSKAWNVPTVKDVLPRTKNAQGNLVIPPYIPRYDSLKRSIPHVCLKVPTGGGKTLLAAEGVGKLQTDLFHRQTGMVLWIVPSVQIYRQTWKALSNRQHPYRQSLERASGGRVKVLEKDDAFTKQDTENYLCIMLIRLAAANRTSNKEFLRIFRDAGKYSSSFPEVDDYTANNALRQQFEDLETNDVGDKNGIAGLSIKHSLMNVLKMQRPVVVIDEGHKAYSENTRMSLNNFNPSFILELTATPNAKELVSNILVDVSGVELKDEQMIKLPINIFNTSKGDWEDTLTKAHHKLQELGKDSAKLLANDGRYIRPIMLIRAERTGKDQRDGKKIHALDAKDFLINRLSVKEDQIRIKTSETDELGNDDLLDPLSPVRYIITKEALQEGWDCPFAYVLTLLDKTTAQTALTQMIGRVLRQPETRSTSFASLNECYVFCFEQNVENAVENVRKGLEEEGMTGIGEFVRASGAGAANDDEASEPVKIKRRDKFKGLKIFLPKVLHKDGKDWREISYEADILAEIDWESIAYDAGHFLDNKDNPDMTRTRVDVRPSGKNGQHEFKLVTATAQETVSYESKLDIAFLSRQLLDIVPNPWQASRIILETIDALKKRKMSDTDIFAGRLYLIESMKSSLKKKVQELSESIFRQKLKDGQICFKLLTNGNEKLNFEILKELTILAKKNERQLVKKNNKEIDNSLFECVFEKELNGLEKDFALYISDDEAVTWWHRMVARQDYSLQGWQRNKIYPDFVACLNNGKFLVIETKGLQLKGNDDTEYKRRLLDLLSEYHRTMTAAGEIDVTDGGKKSLTLTMLMSDEDWKKKYGMLK